MSLIGLGLLKQSVSPVQVVQHAQYPVALVEPGGERRVVKAGVLLSGLPYPTPAPAVLTTCGRITQGTVAHSWRHSRLKTCHLWKALRVIAVHTSQNLWQRLACSGRFRDHLHQDPLEHLLKCRFPGPAPPATDTWVPHTWSGTHEPAFEKHIGLVLVQFHRPHLRKPGGFQRVHNSP